MIVERLTYSQAVDRLDEAWDEVDRLEEELRRAHRTLRIATAEMHHAVYERLSAPLP